MPSSSSAASPQLAQAPVPGDEASRPQVVRRSGGRTFRRDPIIPTTWKVCLVVGLIFAVTLAVLAILVAKGTLHPPGIVASGVKYGAIITGGAQVLALPFLADHYFIENRRRGLEERLADNPSKAEKKLRVSLASSPIRQTPPISQDVAASAPVPHGVAHEELEECTLTNEDLDTFLKGFCRRSCCRWVIL